jgi:hypothetical protein
VVFCTEKDSFSAVLESCVVAQLFVGLCMHATVVCGQNLNMYMLVMLLLHKVHQRTCAPSV